MQGWEIVAAEPEEGRIEATATTFWFGFKDDVVIRVTPAGNDSLLRAPDTHHVLQRPTIPFSRYSDRRKWLIEFHIFGASGSGTSTLGATVAAAMGGRFLNADAYYWHQTDPPFTSKRDPAERVSLIERDITGSAPIRSLDLASAGPTVPSGDVELLAGSASGFPDANDTNHDATPTFRVTLADVEQGDRVELLLDGDAFAAPLLKVLDAKDIADGHVDLTVKVGGLGGSGAKAINAVVSDPAGNSSTSPTLELMVDAAAPEVCSGNHGS